MGFDEGPDLSPEADAALSRVKETVKAVLEQTVPILLALPTGESSNGLAILALMKWVDDIESKTPLDVSVVATCVSLIGDMLRVTKRASDEVAVLKGITRDEALRLIFFPETNTNTED